MLFKNDNTCFSGKSEFKRCIDQKTGFPPLHAPLGGKVPVGFGGNFSTLLMEVFR